MSTYMKKGEELVDYVLKFGKERGTVAITQALAEADQTGFNEALKRQAERKK